MKPNFIAIIPARYNLAEKSTLQLVYEQVKKAVETVYIATDDSRFFDAVQSFGAKAVMISPNHQNSSDCCFEALSLIKKEERNDIIINVQYNETLILSEQIEILKSCFEDPTTQIATLIKAFPYNGFFDDLAKQNTTKVVINKRMEAMYFSRSIIPYKRGTDRNHWLEAHTYYKHIEMYAYRAEVLREITQLPQSSLELAESLEQLRWLENGYKIKVGIDKER